MAEVGFGSSPILTEAYAMRLACLEAVAVCPYSCIVKDDCLEVVNVVLGIGPCPGDRPRHHGHLVHPFSFSRGDRQAYQV